jgi:general secretion pathway protein A
MTDTSIELAPKNAQKANPNARSADNGSNRTCECIRHSCSTEGPHQPRDPEGPSFDSLEKPRPRLSRLARRSQCFALRRFHATMRLTPMSSHKDSRAAAVLPKVREWFGLRENPFRDNARADYYFPLSSHERAVEHCIRSVVNQTGMPLIHGPEGTGKSMLGTVLRARFAEGTSGLTFKTHVIDGSVHSRSSTPALRELSLALGGKKATPNYRLYDEIETLSTARLESGGCVVVLLERAELFQDDMMRMVLFLWNLVTRDGSQFLVRLIAFGRPDYLRTLEKTKYANIRSRTVFGAPGLKAFTLEELASVIRHRFSVAGGSGDAFDDDALAEVHRISAGNPRRALAVASRALVVAHKQSAHSVGADFVRSVEALVR